MGNFMEPSGDISAEIQAYILGELAGRPRTSVVSVYPIVSAVRFAFPHCALGAQRLASVISEAAMLLGLIPVINPVFRDDAANNELAFGYGHPAHRPDPSAAYGFNPGPARTLPVRRDRRHLPAK